MDLRDNFRTYLLIKVLYAAYVLALTVVYLFQSNRVMEQLSYPFYYLAFPAALTGLFLALYKTRGSLRFLWWMLLLATASFFTGELIFGYIEIFKADLPPVPFYNDLFYVLFYLFFSLGLWVYRTKFELPKLVSLAVDYVIVLSVFLVLYFFFYKDLIGPDILENIFSIIYPVADIFLIMLIFYLFDHSSEAIIPYLMPLGLGLFMLSVSDLAYLYLTAKDFYTVEIMGNFAWLNLIDLGWVIGFLFISLAGWQHYLFGDRALETRRLSATKENILLRLTMPYLLIGLTFIPLIAEIYLTNKFISLAAMILLAALLATRAMVTNFRLCDIIMREIKAAYTDKTTGLFNRNFITRQLKKEIDRAKTFGTPLLVMLADIDHIHQINYVFGYHSGDKVIKRVAKMIKRDTRAFDIIARTGNDDFLILMPGTTFQVGIAIASKIRERIQKRDFRGIPVTVSVGVAEYPSSGTNLDELLTAAENGLRKAKEEGNKVYFKS